MEKSELDRRFTYHPPPNNATKQKYEQIRENVKYLATTLNTMCPDSREFSLAITHLEEVVFWANASIARETPPD